MLVSRGPLAGAPCESPHKSPHTIYICMGFSIPFPSSIDVRAFVWATAHGGIVWDTALQALFGTQPMSICLGHRCCRGATQSVPTRTLAHDTTRRHQETYIIFLAGLPRHFPQNTYESICWGHRCCRGATHRRRWLVSPPSPPAPGCLSAATPSTVTPKPCKWPEHLPAG